MLAAENELLRKQLAEVQAALAAKERGPPANPLQFRPRPELDLPPVTAPELIDDGTLNLVAAAGAEAHALDAAAKQRKAAGGDEGLPVWVAAPDGVSANTASAVDSVLSAHLHAEEGAAAFMYDDVAAAVDRFGAAAEAAFDDEDGDRLVDCEDPDCELDIACAPTYWGEVRAIFMERCDDCHTVNDNGELNFLDYADILEPSYFCRGMSKGECALSRIIDGSMPSDCPFCVPDEEIETLEAWIQAGLPEGNP